MELINFTGKGNVNGKEVEVLFKTTLDRMTVDLEDLRYPEIKIVPLKSKEEDKFVQINTVENNDVENGGNHMQKELEDLKIKATLAYLGWLKGDDVAFPMNTLRIELERQGVDIKVITQVYDQLRRK